MEYNVITYTLKTPVIYNEGTKWEKKADTFLFCYTPLNDDEIVKVVDELNATKPTNYNNRPIDWEKIAYLGINKQPIFE